MPGNVSWALPRRRSVGPLPVVVGNIVPIAGIAVLGWSASAVLLVYLAELAAICLWSVLKVPFAHKRPNNAIDDRFVLLGPLQEKRGSITLPGPFPPVYVRNLPLLIVGTVLTPVVVGLAFVVFALTRPEITDSVAAAFLLGGAVVFVTRGVETWNDYFRSSGYRDHSARSVLLAPFKYVFLLGTLFIVVLGVESSIGVDGVLTPERAVLLLAVGKLGYDLRSYRIEHDDERRSLFAKLYGSKNTEIEPEPVETPTKAPEYHVSMRRRATLADAAAHGLAYGFGYLGIFTWLIIALGMLGKSIDIVLVGVLLGLGLSTLRAITRYIRYGTLVYHCYADTLVAYDHLLAEPQAKLDAHTVTDVTVSRGYLDRILGTETLTFDVASIDEMPNEKMFVIDAQQIDTDDDANRSTALTLPHIHDSRQVTDTLALSWYLRDGTDP